MTRIKRGLAAHKRRKKIIREAKGYKWGRKSKYRLAKEALLQAWSRSYKDRKRKKRDFRRLWQIKINAASRQHNLSYSQFIHGLKTAQIDLDRKILAQLAEKHPKVFKQIVDLIKK